MWKIAQFVSKMVEMELNLSVTTLSTEIASIHGLNKQTHVQLAGLCRMIIFYYFFLFILW